MNAYGTGDDSASSLIEVVALSSELPGGNESVDKQERAVPELGATKSVAVGRGDVYGWEDDNPPRNLRKNIGRKRSSM